MKSELIAIISGYLDVAPEELQDYRTLEDLHIDSLDFIEIMFEIEEKYDVPVGSDIQRHRDEIHNLGDVLRLTEELILKDRGVQPANANG
ncbi:phosphopantetheine-binding protein [Aurantimonas sp. 22II-16-19i]|uniref:acyl carrier protein n=1 Tax=Aurantimonas sp. 22II-16-19i TaxID=1317114 RepID=UPI0009F7A77D|nr:phosphopantetheine-binding protein [Aurantimonas sp. 22II-16-19i]ORE92725.1 hypothetical protein ATO4_16900 [Aurantimonas sp. 22II-16-19i]